MTEEKKAAVISMKVSTAIHAELQKLADTTGKSLHTVTEEVFFAKLAIKKEQDGSIDKEDAKCSVFELAIKYKIDVIKQLTASANLKLKLEQIATEQEKQKKLQNGGTKIEYVDKFCCPSCMATFESQHLCMTHFNKSHEQDHEAKALYLCPYCTFERMCSSASALQAHMLVEHKEKFNPPPTPIQRPIPAIPPSIIEVKTYACFCGFTCKDITELGRHYAKCQKIRTIAGRVSA